MIVDVCSIEWWFSLCIVLATWLQNRWVFWVINGNLYQYTMPVSIHGAWHEISRPNQTDKLFQLFSTCGHPNRSPQEKGCNPQPGAFYCRICISTTRKTRPVSYTLWLNTSKKIDPALHLTTNQRRWEGEKKGVCWFRGIYFSHGQRGPKGKAIVKGHYINNWKTDTYIKMNILSLTQPTLALPTTNITQPETRLLASLRRFTPASAHGKRTTGSIEPWQCNTGVVLAAAEASKRWLKGK